MTESSRNMFYTGTVVHNRNSPRTHKFTYSLIMLYLDVDQVEAAFNESTSSRLWSVGRFNGANFRRADFHGNPDNDLKSEVIATVAKSTGLSTIDTVRILTNIRYFGICFNPVSFYYCFNKDNELEAIVSEIENTPWSERHAYVHKISDKKRKSHAFDFDKEFHVSPFMPMDIRYKWVFSNPSKNLNISMFNQRAGEKVFETHLVLRGNNLNEISLDWELIKVPYMSVKTILGIYWQAFKLYLKKIPFYDHPNPTSRKNLTGVK